jgi:hypothetical protein
VSVAVGVELGVGVSLGVAVGPAARISRASISEPSLEPPAGEVSRM